MKPVWTVSTKYLAVFVVVWYQIMEAYSSFDLTKFYIRLQMSVGL